MQAVEPCRSTTPRSGLGANDLTATSTEMYVAEIGEVVVQYSGETLLTFSGQGVSNTY